MLIFVNEKKVKIYLIKENADAHIFFSMTWKSLSYMELMINDMKTSVSPS